MIYDTVNIFELIHFKFIDFDRSELNNVKLINTYFSIIEL